MNNKVIKKYQAFASSLILTFLSLYSGKSVADPIESATITLIDAQHNSSSWAASNLTDADLSTRWLSSKQTNDINFQLTTSENPICIAGMDLTNYGNDDRSVKEFMLLTTTDSSLAADSGTAGWRPVIADENPSGLLNYTSWAQGARITDIDSQHNSTSWAAANINDGSTESRWLSSKSNNTIEFEFDTNWSGTAGDSIAIDEIEVVNYGVDDRSVKEFQVEVTTDGSNWFKLEVPTSASGDEEYIYSRYQDGGILSSIDSQHNTTSWAAKNMQDGDSNSRWLSSKGNNEIEFTFDPDNDGTTSLAGDVTDAFNLEKFNIENYGNDDRSVREFQIAVKTLSDSTWQKIRVPGASVGQANYNFASLHHGASLSEIDSQHNSTSWAAQNLHDGDNNTRWLSSKGNNYLAFQFDVDEDGQTSAAGDTADAFTLASFHLINYGNDDRSIKEFQLAVKTTSNSNWQKLVVPGSAAGQANFNFALSHHGGQIVHIDSEHNSTSWAAANIHDGDNNTRWLSSKGNNTLDFQFDNDEDGQTGSSGDTDDVFSIKSIYLQNYGNDDRSIRDFQVAVKTTSNANWQKLNVPGASAGQADYNFALAAQGGQLTAIDSEHNSTSWAAANLHDGDANTRWLSSKGNNTLDFQFDADEDGSPATATDYFKLESFYLENYGNDDRSVKHFQLEVKTASNTNWTKIPVPGTNINDADYQFSLSHNGGTLVSIDAEHNSTSWAAANIHDGDQNTRWLSSKQINTLEFNFDTDLNGAADNTINLDKVSMINYGNDDRSVNTFEIDVMVASVWQTVDAPGGGTVFTAAMNSNEQTWSITPISSVQAVRFRSLTNYGDPSYTGVAELTFSGNSIGPSYTFTAAMTGSGESFSIDAADQPVDVTDVRFRSINNHGDPSYIGAAELRLLGVSISATKTFTAAMNGNGETFTLDAEDVPINVTDVRLITINNHGDPDYIGAAEFSILGDSLAPSNTFSASMHNNGETFTLDIEDIPTNVTDVRLITINNHGDPDYIGATEIQLLGDSITETKTFSANMTSTKQSITLDPDDIPVGVTSVKFISINNYGDPDYVGLTEFEAIGESVTPAHTFTLPMTSTPHKITLDADDKVTGIIGARLVTIKNHGDPSYIGMAEFRLLGTANSPSYIFSANMDTTTQGFNFSSTPTKLFRFHSLSNHGDPSYTGAAELSLNSGICNSPQWRMDESGWTGASNEVTDASNSGYDGQAFGFGTAPNPQTSQTSPALTGDPGTCSYGVFDGVDDYLYIPDGENLDNLSQMTITAWIKADSFSQTNGFSSRGVVSKGPAGGGNVSYGLFFNNSTGDKLQVDIDGSGDRFSSNASFAADTWYHIAVVFDGTQPSSQRVKLYIDGVLDGTFSESSSSIPNTNDDFYIGNLLTATNDLNVFDGAIDEVNFSPLALSSAEVTELMNTRRECAVELHHIQLQHNSSALTCSPETINVKACLDASCTNVYPTDVTFDLTSTGNASTFSQDPVTIPANSTAGVNITLTNTTAEELSVGGSSTPNASNALVCTGNAEGDCTITYNSSGYLLTLNNHTSCATENFTIQAVQLSQTSTNCAPVYSGDQSVNFKFNYTSPASGTVIPTIAGTSLATAGSSQTRTVNFDSNASATLDFVYQDAGQISIEVSDAGTNGLSTSSVTTVVSPAKLVVSSPDANSDCAAGDASCSAFTKAGENFNLAVSAQCANDTVTPNFEMADIPLSVTTIAPNLGNSVSLGVNTISLVDADNGTATLNNQTISEVGVFTITATPANNGYFGQTIPAATSNNLGRFIPDHFTLAASTVSNANGNFTYMSQPELEFTYNIEAQNASNEVVQNYTGSFVKSSIELVAEDVPALAANHTNQTSRLSNDFDGSWSAGIYTNQANNKGNFTRLTNTPDGPYDNLLFGIKVTDPDGSLLQNLDMREDTNTDCVAADNCTAKKLSNTESQIRFGRILLENTLGSELSPLRMPMKTQYWDGSKFVTNTLDSFTTFDATVATGNVSLTYVTLADGSTQESGTGTFTQGETNGFSLDAPDNGATGEVRAQYSTPDWLKYDWDNEDSNLDGPFDDNPSATAIFGRYRGHDRIIYKRER